ncbi:MAG TPA: class I SAM-dependent methyltransferase [Anaerolineae bacterium]
MTVNFDKVSLTAKLAAYMRQYSDIPYAREVAEHIQAREAFEKLLADSRMSPEDLLWYAPIFEIRYKSIAETIRKSGARQILELASGISLRGLAMTQDPALTYVETDLEEITQEKAALVSILRRQYNLTERGNHHLVAANALDALQLRAAVKSFRHDQPIAVVNEGLFQYLSAGEMNTVAENIRDLLAEFGGIWITPDFSLKEDVRDVSEQQRRFRSVVAAATDRNLYNNAFDNNAQLLAFLDSLGLHAQVLNQVDVAPNVVCMVALKLPPQILERARPGLKLWVLSLDDHR